MIGLFLLSSALQAIEYQPLSLSRDSNINDGKISVLVSEKVPLELIPSDDIYIAGLATGGIIGLAMIEGAKNALAKNFEITVNELKNFDFENYIAEKLVKEISSRGKFEAEKDSNPLIKSLMSQNFSRQNPLRFMTKPAYKRFKKKEAVKINSNLFLHPAVIIGMQGNKKTGAIYALVTFAIADKDLNKKEPIWYFRQLIETQILPPSRAKQLKPEFMKLLDKAIQEAVDHLHE